MNQDCIDVKHDYNNEILLDHEFDDYNIIIS